LEGVEIPKKALLVALEQDIFSCFFGKSNGLMFYAMDGVEGYPGYGRGEWMGSFWSGLVVSREGPKETLE